jgi:hypothetical protein
MLAAGRCGSAGKAACNNLPPTSVTDSPERLPLTCPARLELARYLHVLNVKGPYNRWTACVAMHEASH